MFFTEEDYKKIEKYLASCGVKDSCLEDAKLPIEGNEKIAIVQNGENRILYIRELLEALSNSKASLSDLYNVTDHAKEKYINLKQAIELVPYKARKIGQIITFLNPASKWGLYQFQGTSILQWNELSLWNDFFNLDSYVIKRILPDEEDLTKLENDGKGNSYLSLKDREYNPDEFSGLGKVILRKNIMEVETEEYGKVKKNVLLQDMINKPNTIYEIRYDFDLLGKNISIKKGCVLKFEGGKIKNGSIIFNEVSIQSALSYIFENIECKGKVLGSIPVEYFGTFAYDSTSIDLAVSLKNIYSISNIAQLGEGRYYTRESSIEINSLIGKGKNSSIIEFLNIKNNTAGFRFGKTIGGPENRTWNNYIAGVQIEIKDVGAVGTSVVEINNVTRSTLERVTLINFNYRKSEYNAEELNTPETCSNCALVLNGSSELVDVSNYTFIADIPIFVKKSCDFFSLRKGYLECSKLGFAGIHGLPLGTNSEISGGLDIAHGLYGIHFTAKSYDTFRTYYTNIRIEQLRPGGANIYLNAQVPIISMSLNCISLSDTTKGIEIEGNANCSLFCNNIICLIDKYDLFDIKNEKAVLKCSNFSVNSAKKFENVTGVTILNTGDYSVKSTFTINKDPITITSYFCNTLTVKRDCITIERPVLISNTTYINSVLYSSIFKYNSILLDFNVYDGGIIATMKLSLHIEDGKFTKLSIIEDKLKLSKYIDFKINVDKYLDIYIKSGANNLLYNFSGINFESSDKLSLVKPTSGITSQRPTLTSTEEGFEYYDSTLKKKILWNGTEWTNMDGASL